MAVIERKTAGDGSPRFRVKLRVKGFDPVSATFTKMADARRFAVKKEHEFRSRRYGLSAEADHRTAEEMIARYVKTILRTKSHKKKFLRQQQQQLKWWQAELSGLKVAEVTPALISEKRDKLQATLKPSTVNNYLAALSHVFTMARREWQWIEHSPFQKINKLKTRNAGLRFLAPEEITALLKICAGMEKKPLQLIVAMALATGARKGEILGLQWRDVDLSGRYAVAHDTKNSESRRLYFGDYVHRLLWRYMASKTRPGLNLSKYYVFSNRFGNRPIRVDKEFSAACKAAGIKNFRFHDLRHTAASYLAMNKANASDIAEVLGHKSLGMVKRYAHLSEKHTAGVVNSMNEKIFAGSL